MYDLPGRFGIRPSEGREILALAALIGVSPELIVGYLRGSASEWTVARIEAARAASAAVNQHWIWSCSPTALLP